MKGKIVLNKQGRLKNEYGFRESKSVAHELTEPIKRLGWTLYRHKKVYPYLRLIPDFYMYYLEIRRNSVNN